ncbi:MAG: GNAT family N-acetyltransferase [Promethearchaeota archaeon]
MRGRKILRRAILRDFKQIAALRKELFGEFSHERFKSYISKNPDLVLVIQEKGKIIGYCVGVVAKEGMGRIYQIGVERDHLNKGHMNRLLTYIMDALRKRGCREIRTSFIAEESLGFFLKHGFKIRETVFSYEKTDFATPVKGNQSLVIRPFRPDDVEVLLELEHKCFEPFWHTSREEFISWTRIPEASFFVGIMNDAIVAYNFNVIVSETGHYGRIAVHPDYRRQGVGTRMTVNAIEWFEKKGAKKILLNTQVSNIEARRMYEKLGFRILKKLYLATYA